MEMEFKDLKGKTIADIQLKKDDYGDDEVYFTSSDGGRFKIHSEEFGKGDYYDTKIKLKEIKESDDD